MNPRNRTLIIVLGAVAAIVVIFVIANLAGGDDESSGGVVDPSETTEASSDSLEQTRPVEVTGDPIPPLDDTAAEDPAIGTAFPLIEGQSFDGTPITIGGSAGGPTLAVYLAHWCPACNAEVPELIEADNRGGIPAALSIVGVSTAVDETRPNYPPSEWLDDNDWRWPVMADDAGGTAFFDSGGTSFPYLVLLDEDGTILDRESGTRSAEEIAAWIQESFA